MTILSVFQAASTRIGIERPTGVMSSGEQEHIELAAMANEVGEMIARAAEWQVLTRLRTMTGDGSDTDFVLPSDFGWFVEGTELRSSNWPGQKLRHVLDRDEWLRNLLVPSNPAPPDWTLFDGAVHFNPAPASGETIKFYYVSNQFATGIDLANKAAFTAPWAKVMRLWATCLSSMRSPSPAKSTV